MRRVRATSSSPAFFLRGGANLFNFISKKFRPLIIDDDYICNLILKTVKENLTTNWDIQFVDHFDNMNSILIIELEEEKRNAITIITSPYYGNEKLEKGFEGYMQFNLSAIKKSISNLGYFDSIKKIKSMVLHDVRYCQQFDFLRETGGDEFIHRVNYLLYGTGTPPEENILEVHAKAFQLYGIKFDFNDILARYLKNDNESGDISGRCLQNSRCQPKFF